MRALLGDPRRPRRRRSGRPSARSRSGARRASRSRPVAARDGARRLRVALEQLVLGAARRAPTSARRAPAAAAARASSRARARASATARPTARCRRRRATCRGASRGPPAGRDDVARRAAVDRALDRRRRRRDRGRSPTPTLSRASSSNLAKSWKPAAMRSRHASRVERREVVAVDGDPPVGRLVEAAEQLDERRLAGAVLADERDGRARRQVEVDVVRGRRPSVTGIAERHALERDAVARSVPGPAQSARARRR